MRESQASLQKTGTRASSLTAATAKLSCSHISDTPRTFEIINLGCFKGKLGVTGYSGMNISNILSLMCLIIIIKEE